jgi:hypothetical protein
MDYYDELSYIIMVGYSVVRMVVRMVVVVHPVGVVHLVVRMVVRMVEVVHLVGHLVGVRMVVHPVVRMVGVRMVV